MQPNHPEPIHKVSTGSTNDDLRVLADQGSPHLSMVLADEQVTGRGRHGRTWVSPKGNYYGSILIRLQPNWPEVSNLVTLIALAIREVLLPYLDEPDDLSLKWPNDILLKGQKLTGMLLETGGFADGKPSWIIAGVGMNLTTAPPAGDALYPPTTLAAHISDVPKPLELAKALQARIALELDTWSVQGFAPLRNRFLAHAHNRGKVVRVGTTSDKSLYISGIFRDLDADGALVVELENKEIRRFHAADILI